MEGAVNDSSPDQDRGTTGTTGNPGWNPDKPGPRSPPCPITLSAARPADSIGDDGAWLAWPAITNYLTAIHAGYDDDLRRGGW